MTSTIIKHSERTVRQGCPDCGSRAVYQGHDTGTEYSVTCTRCNVNGSFVLIDRTEFTNSLAVGESVPTHYLHSNSCTGVKQDVKAAEIDAKESTVSAPAVTAPVAPTAVSAAVPDVATLLGQLAQVLARPQIDPTDIDRIITDRFNAIVFPTRTVIVREQERREIEGMTHPKLADVITDLLSGEHVMAVGPAGTGKSTIGMQAAEACGLTFYSISVGPQTPESRFVGFIDANGNYRRTPFREAYENGGVFLLDEIDNGNAGVLNTLNAALANPEMAFPDGMVKRHDDFRVIATANTYGLGADRQYIGRQQLDAALLDRFSIEDIEIDEGLETHICNSIAGPETVIRVLSLVRKVRKAAAEKRMPVVISPRASIGMCKLIAGGRTFDDAVKVRLRRGMSDADWSKISA